MTSITVGEESVADRLFFFPPARLSFKQLSGVAFAFLSPHTDLANKPQRNEQKVITRRRKDTYSKAHTVGCCLFVYALVIAFVLVHLPPLSSAKHVCKELMWSS